MTGLTESGGLAVGTPQRNNKPISDGTLCCCGVCLNSKAPLKSFISLVTLPVRLFVQMSFVTNTISYIFFCPHPCHAHSPSVIDGTHRFRSLIVWFVIHGLEELLRLFSSSNIRNVKGRYNRMSRPRWHLIYVSTVLNYLVWRMTHLFFFAFRYMNTLDIYKFKFTSVICN